MNAEQRRTLEKRQAVRVGISRLVFAVTATSAEIAFLVILFTRLNEHREWAAILTRAVALIMAMAIHSRQINAAMKMPWILLILTMPVFGILMYVMTDLSKPTRREQRLYRNAADRIRCVLSEGLLAEEDVADASQVPAAAAAYLRNIGQFPVYRHTGVTYFPDTRDALESQIAAMRSAGKFIFLEYFAIEDASAFEKIKEVLIEKAAQHVEVRIFYDDIGSILHIDRSFAQRMQAYGIKCRIFNPVHPLLNVFVNHRDHRKITVVDGKIAFTGGYNLADEYFNLVHPYGEWKDAGLRIEGPAVQTLTAAFLEMWDASDRKQMQQDTDPARYLLPAEPCRPAKGFVQPYTDSPIENERIGENVYLNLIGHAKTYLWFMTPYLIITDEMISALTLAAKNGVDVRIVTPGIPDKKLVYQTTRSYYHVLTESGVRIFEFTPGFCHAKLCVSDDQIAACGTINLDFRSLYHHFENGCLLMDNPAVLSIRDDFLQIFPRCHEVTEEYRAGRSRRLRLGQYLLRLLAPLL